MKSPLIMKLQVLDNNILEIMVKVIWPLHALSGPEGKGFVFVSFCLVLDLCNIQNEHVCSSL